MKYEKLTEKIIGCAYGVYNELGFGFLESVYRNALLIELREAGLQATAEQEIKVYFRDHEVGVFSADIVAEGKIILELKSARQIAKGHEVQLVNYLVATRSPVGLLLNFGPDGVDVRRKVPQLPDAEV